VLRGLVFDRSVAGFVQAFSDKNQGLFKDFSRTICWKLRTWTSHKMKYT
jgi:hypothetical protein